MVNFDYLYNPEVAKPILSRNYFIDKKSGFQVIENGTILPCKFEKVVNSWSWKNYLGGIIDSEGKFIAGTHVHRGIGKGYTPPPWNQLYVAPKLLFISDIFFLFGGMLLLTIFVACGF